MYLMYLGALVHLLHLQLLFLPSFPGCVPFLSLLSLHVISTLNHHVDAFSTRVLGFYDSHGILVDRCFSILLTLCGPLFSFFLPTQGFNPIQFQYDLGFESHPMVLALKFRPKWRWFESPGCLRTTGTSQSHKISWGIPVTCTFSP